MPFTPQLFEGVELWDDFPLSDRCADPQRPQPKANDHQSRHGGPGLQEIDRLVATSNMVLGIATLVRD